MNYQEDLPYPGQKIIHGVPLRILVACEHSGTVRDAFRARGHHAVSCDLIDDESEHGGAHILGDCKQAILEHGPWELMKANSTACVMENPVGVLPFKPSQYIQPWEHGHGETKKTGLWIHNLPNLQPTDIVPGREQRVWKMGPSPDRWKMRSLTYRGIARAMAEQWSPVAN